jgi:hypothetical protein
MNTAEFKKSLEALFSFKFQVEQTDNFILYADADDIRIIFRMESLDEEFFDLETQETYIQYLSSLREVKEALIKLTRANVNKLNNLLSLLECDK